MPIQLIRVSEALQIDTSLLRHVAKDDRMKAFKDSRRRNCIERKDLAEFFLSSPWYARRLFVADPPTHLSNLFAIMRDDYSSLTGRDTMLYFGTSEIGGLLGVNKDQASVIIRHRKIPYVIDGNSYFVHEYDFIQFLKKNNDYHNKLRTRISENEAIEDARKHLISILDHKEITTSLPKCTKKKEVQK